MQLNVFVPSLFVVNVAVVPAGQVQVVPDPVTGVHTAPLPPETCEISFSDRGAIEEIWGLPDAPRENHITLNSAI